MVNAIVRGIGELRGTSMFAHKWLSDRIEPLQLLGAKKFAQPFDE